MTLWAASKFCLARCLLFTGEVLSWHEVLLATCNDGATTDGFRFIISPHVSGAATVGGTTNGGVMGEGKRIGNLC